MVLVLDQIIPSVSWDQGGKGQDGWCGEMGHDRQRKAVPSGGCLLGIA